MPACHGFDKLLNCVTSPTPHQSMQFEKYVSRMQYLQELIEKQSTGTPKELASRLGISERMLYYYLDALNTNERTVKFSRKKISFVFHSLQ